MSSGEGGHGSVELIFDLKLELNEMKQKLDSVVTDLSVVKEQVQEIKMDYVVICNTPGVTSLFSIAI